MEENYSQLDQRLPSATDTQIEDHSKLAAVYKKISTSLVPILSAATVLLAANQSKADTTTLPDDPAISLGCEGTLSRTGAEEITCNLDPNDPPQIYVTKVTKGSCKELEDKGTPVTAIGQSTVTRLNCKPQVDKDGNINNAYSTQTYMIEFPSNGRNQVTGKVMVATNKNMISYAMNRPEQPLTKTDADTLYQPIGVNQYAPLSAPQYPPTPNSDPETSNDSGQNNGSWFDIDLGYQLEMGDYQTDKTNGGYLSAGLHQPFSEESDWYYGGILKSSYLKSNMELHNLDSADPNVSQEIKRFGIGPSLTWMPSEYIGLNLNALGGLSIINTGEVALRHDLNNNTYVLTEGEQLGPFFGLNFGTEVHAGPFEFGANIGLVYTPNSNEIPADRKQRIVFPVGFYAGIKYVKIILDKKSRTAYKGILIYI